MLTYIIKGPPCVKFQVSRYNSFDCALIPDSLSFVFILKDYSIFMRLTFLNASFLLNGISDLKNYKSNLRYLKLCNGEIKLLKSV